jgi:hypothetical protein
VPASFFEVQVCEGTVGGYALETATRDDAVDFGPAFLSAQYLLPSELYRNEPQPTPRHRTAPVGQGARQGRSEGARR